MWKEKKFRLEISSTLEEVRQALDQIFQHEHSHKNFFHLLSLS